MANIRTKRLLLVLAISLLLLFLFTISLKNNQDYKIYVREDMKQSVIRLNQYISDSSIEIRSVIRDNKINVNQLESLEQQHSIISKEINNLHLKGRITGGKLKEEAEKVYSAFFYSKPLNEEAINQYYKTLSKKSVTDKYIKLESMDITELESIISFYNEFAEKLSYINH